MMGENFISYFLPNLVAIKFIGNIDRTCGFFNGIDDTLNLKFRTRTITLDDPKITHNIAPIYSVFEMRSALYIDLKR